MKKLPDLKNIKLNDLFSGLAKNLSLVFFAAFLLIVLLEIFEVNTSLQIILSANKAPAAAPVAKGIRVDFTDYNKIVQRIQQAANFTPSASSSMPDPFGTGH